MPLAPAPRLRLAALVAIALLVLPACDGGGGDTAATDADLVARFASRDRYAPLADALTLTGVDAALRDGGPFTVLAPTRIAFRFLGSDFSPVLFDAPQRQTLAGVLRHHVVARRLGPEDFTDGAAFTALDGSILRVKRVGPVVIVNGVTLDVTDAFEAGNGVAYPLADVLLDGISTAERVRLSPSLSQLANGLRSTGALVEATAAGPVTLLAPTNDAYNALGGLSQALFNPDNADALGRSMRALVLPGNVDLAALDGLTVATLGGTRLPVTVVDGTIRVDGIPVFGQETTADGRLYLLGSPVLSVLRVFDHLRVQPALTNYRSDISELPTLQALIADPNQPVTVFAPTNFAYDNRSRAAIELLAEQAQAPLVRRVTATHVVRGTYRPDDLTDGLRLTSVDGTVLTVGRRDGALFIDGREVSLPPIAAVDGVAYRFDYFALPDVDLFDTLILKDFARFARAVRSAGLEQAYRTTVRTAFVVQDDSVSNLLRRPNLAAALRYTATAEPIPVLRDATLPKPFTVLSGETRTLRYDSPCSGRNCSPYAIGLRRVETPNPQDGLPPIVTFVPDPQVTQGASTPNGRQTYHVLLTVDRTVPGASRPGL